MAARKCPTAVLLILITHIRYLLFYLFQLNMHSVCEHKGHLGRNVNTQDYIYLTYEDALLL